MTLAEAAEIILRLAEEKKPFEQRSADEVQACDPMAEVSLRALKPDLYCWNKISEEQ